MADPASGVSDWVDRLFVYDGGGSVRALTDLEGNITDTFSYDAYGNLLHPSSLFLPTSYLYRGERYDPDLGQYYLRARFYDPNLGRFHTLDEYEGRTGEPLSLHKYLYAHANPVTGWDPSGRMLSLGEVTLVSCVAGMAASITSFAVLSGRSTAFARDCEQEQIDCVKGCMATRPPWPLDSNGPGHYSYCQRKCLDEYMDCREERRKATRREFVRNVKVAIVIGVGTAATIAIVTTIPQVAPGVIEGGIVYGLFATN